VTELPEQISSALALAAGSPGHQVGLRPVEEIRQESHDAALATRVPRTDGVTWVDVEVPAGATWAGRIYRPQRIDPQRLPVLFVHGGGWAICDLETHHSIAADLAGDNDALVLSVEYRLAPEHPYPAGLEDCQAAARWLAANAESWGAAATDLIIVGDSSGGNLAAATVLALAREPDAPAIALQVLVYPVLDDDFGTASWVEYGDGRLGFGERQMRWFWDQYAPAGIDRADPLVAPLRAEDLTAFPPTVIVVGSMDPLRSECETFAARLVEAGVETTLRVYEHGYHGFYSARQLLDLGGEAALDVSSAIRSVSAR
jgi:acetyl esterase